MKPFLLTSVKSCFCVNLLIDRLDKLLKAGRTHTLILNSNALFALAFRPDLSEIFFKQ